MDRLASLPLSPLKAKLETLLVPHGHHLLPVRLKSLARYVEEMSDDKRILVGSFRKS